MASIALIFITSNAMPESFVEKNHLFLSGFLETP